MSFSEDGNNEQLWNLYSEMGSGFTLGLGKDEFLLAKDRPAWADVWRVSYDADALAAYCADALQLILATYLSRFNQDHHAHPDWFPPVDQMALAYLQENSHFAPAFKAPDWSYQREWRWAVIRPFEPDSPERYFTLPLGATLKERLLPICSIGAGPHCSDDSMETVKAALARLGYDNVILRRV
jgi:hypothetical protein